LPTALSLGQYRRAMVWFTIATGCDVRVSDVVNARPSRIGTPIVEK
jgi:hypothetical protein